MLNSLLSGSTVGDETVVKIDEEETLSACELTWVKGNPGLT